MKHGSTAPETAALLAHEGFVRAIVRSLLRDEAEVDDVVQATWLAALESPPRRTSSRRSWLGRVAMNLARDRRRSESRRHRRELRAASPEHVASTESLVERLSRQQAVVEAVLALEEPYRKVVLLRFYDDLPPREIAARLGIAVDTVHTRLRRAREQLRGKLERQGRDLRAWLLAAWPELDRSVPAAITVSTAAWVTGAILMGLKTKLGLVAVTAIIAGAAFTLEIANRQEPARPSSSDLAQSPSDSGTRATRVISADRQRAVTRTESSSATGSNRIGDTELPEQSIDPACQEERLLERLSKLEEARGERPAPSEIDPICSEVASCGDVAVPTVRNALMQRESIAIDCGRILSLIGSENAIEAGLSILDEPGLADGSYWALCDRRSMVTLLRERHVSSIGSALDKGPASMARRVAAQLLSRLPMAASVEALVRALEDETEAEVVEAILAALVTLGHQHGQAIPLDRVLELVSSETPQQKHDLATLVTIGRPWPQALDWILAHFDRHQYPRWAFQILLESGGQAAEEGLVAAAEKLRAEGRTKFDGIQKSYGLLSMLAQTSDPTWSGRILEDRIRDLEDYEGLERDLFLLETDIAKGNLLLALTLMPENDSVYRVLDALLFPESETDRTLSRRLRRSTWSAVRNLVTRQDHSRRGRAIALIERAFESQPVARGEILSLLEELRSTSPPVGSDVHQLIARLAASADEHWKDVLEDLLNR